MSRVDAPAPGVEPADAAPRGRSLWRDAARRFAANRAAMASVVVLTAIAVMALAVPLLSPYGRDEIFWDLVAAPPDLAGWHPFGTDSNGRDLFVRTMHGARISLLVGIVATAVSLAIGVAYGATAGYLGGRIDGLMMRLVDILYALPFLFFVIILMVVFGRSILLIFVALGAVEWLDMARIVRGQTLSLKRREFIEAARALGVPALTIVRRHVVPNLLGPIVVFATLTVPRVILFESFLSFLGLGVQEPMASWGVLISDGAKSIDTAPWLLLFPGGFLAATLLALNFIGDGIRDALDPRDR
ncbi:MAG TPA: ABC transporter permease subunit [Candidatus Sulfotelmatobacter sp.]|nr:ABC transporter permease subunit [Candidatus Sulfotelmatobacter sp.]